MRYILLTILMFVTATVSADNLKVLDVNHGIVKVNGQKLKKGTVFDSKDKIVWSDDKQIIKVVGMDSHKISIYAAQTFKVGHIVTIDELLFQKQRLSSRDGILMNIYDFYSFFNRDIALLDAFSTETGYAFDKKHFLFLQYNYRNDTINKRLPCAGHTVEFNDSIFYVDKTQIDDSMIETNLYYYNMEENQTTLLADKLTIHITPRRHVIQFLESYSNEDFSLEELSELTTDYCRIKFPSLTFIASDIKSFLQKWKFNVAK